MKKIAIKSSENDEEQKEIIEMLESLGGINEYRFIGDAYWAYYYIDNNNIIDMTSDINKLKGYVLLTLEQYKEKYKYMGNKELQIIPPEGYEIDKEQSSFEKIVFKKVEEKLTYEKIAKELFSKGCYYIDTFGGIFHAITVDDSTDSSNAPTEYQLKRLLALNKLMNVAYHLNDGWEPNWEDNLQLKYYMFYNNKSKTLDIDYNTYCNLGVVYFKSKTLAKQAIEILGEEIIKLALGI